MFPTLQFCYLPPIGSEMKELIPKDMDNTAKPRSICLIPTTS